MNIDDYVLQEYEYEISKEGPLAEFVESFFYGEADRDEVLKNIEETNIADHILTELSYLDTNTLFSLLQNYCSLVVEDNPYSPDDAILSHGYCGGEIEIDLSKFSQEERNSCIEAYIVDDYGYISTYATAHMVLDIDAITDTFPSWSKELRPKMYDVIKPALRNPK